MALDRRHEAQKKVEETASRQVFSDQSWKFEIKKLLDGESLIMRIGDVPGQPFAYRTHGFSKLEGKFAKSRCMQPEKPCLGCQVAEAEARGRKRVKRAADRQAYVA